MDIATIIGGSAGIGGLAVSILGIAHTRKSAKESVVVRHIELALEAQQDQLDRQAVVIRDQGEQILRQAVELNAQAVQVRELKVRVIRCDQEKRELKRELAEVRRGL